MWTSIFSINYTRRTLKKQPARAGFSPIKRGEMNGLYAQDSTKSY